MQQITNEVNLHEQMKIKTYIYVFRPQESTLCIHDFGLFQIRSDRLFGSSRYQKWEGFL